MFNEAIKHGGVAVITGGASGVGLAAAHRLAAQGLGIVLADFPGEALDAAVADLKPLTSGPVLGVPCDVTQTDQVAHVAERAFDAGEVAVLMLNAGISRPTRMLEPSDNWQAVLEVNLWGVQRGVQAFVPRMIAANRPAVVIATGSKQGITTPPGNPAYNLSKAAVKVMTEQLAYELRDAGAPISAHLFVPGFTYTGMIQRVLPEKPAAAWTSEECVDYMLARVAKGDFYILCPDNDVTEAIDAARVSWAAGDVAENRPALSRWHPDWSEAFAAHEAKARE